MNDVMLDVVHAASVLELVSMASICLHDLNASLRRPAALEYSLSSTGQLNIFGSHTACFPSLSLFHGEVCCLCTVESVPKSFKVPLQPELTGVVKSAIASSDFGAASF